MNIRSGIIIGLSCVTIIALLLPNCTSMLDSFPIGLMLEYHVTYGAYEEWDEQFIIQRWAPEHNANVLLVNFYSNRAGTSNVTMYLEINTWNALFENGSQTSFQLQPPLWINTQSYPNQITVEIPTLPGEYYVISEPVRLLSGTYSSWRITSAVGVFVDDDFPITDETWYFQNSHGVLLKHTIELKASQHSIYTYTFTRQLTTHNMYIHGIFNEEQIRFINEVLIVLLLTISIPATIITSLTLIRNRRRPRNQYHKNNCLSHIK